MSVHVALPSHGFDMHSIKSTKLIRKKLEMQYERKFLQFPYIREIFTRTVKATSRIPSIALTDKGALSVSATGINMTWI